MPSRFALSMVSSLWVIAFEIEWQGGSSPNPLTPPGGYSCRARAQRPPVLAERKCRSQSFSDLASDARHANMLRSIQQLRDSSAVGALLADGEEQLTLMGGGSEYRMPWHWHDCLMIFLPHVGAVDFRDETRQSGAWLSEDRFVVVPPGLAHQTSAARPVHRHVAIYAADGQLAKIEAGIGSLHRVRSKLGRTGFFAMT